MGIKLKMVYKLLILVLQCNYKVLEPLQIVDGHMPEVLPYTITKYLKLTHGRIILWFYYRAEGITC